VKNHVPEWRNERFCRGLSLAQQIVGAAVASVAIISLPATSFADENGISFWLPGIYGSLAAVPQQPGWSFAAINYYDSVGQVVPSPPRAKSPLGGLVQRSTSISMSA
jgi:hypothetical protein